MDDSPEHQLSEAPAKVEPKRSPLRLSLVEREEISRGLASGESLRSIARRLDRAPSTISREVSGNDGPGRYRACRADKAAVRRTRRPKPAKLAQLRTAPGGGGGQARAALVTPADLGLAGGSVPRRAGDAGVPRDDLPVVVRAGPWGAAQRTHPLPATGPRHPSARWATRSSTARAVSAAWSTSANAPPRPTIGPFRATGKAT